jgi:TBC1 domain family member 2
VQKGHGGNDTLSPFKATSPPRRTYTDFLSHTNHDWDANDEEEEELEDEYGYGNDDGDDFGLPSVSSMKRKSKRLTSLTNADPGGGLSPWGHGNQGSDYHLGTRRLSNSQDIATERPAPSYPSPKKSEGKILRPQYKEILRGMVSLEA